MLTLRLQRIGRRNQPYYRVVATDSRFGPKSGRFIEVLGSYDPKAGKVEMKKERVEHWLSLGAQTSDTVHNFLVDKKLVQGKKINNLPQKTPVVKEPTAEELAAKAAAEAPEVVEETTPESPLPEATEDQGEAPAEEAPAPAAEEVKEEAPEAEEKAEEAAPETEAPAAEEKKEEVSAE